MSEPNHTPMRLDRRQILLASAATLAAQSLPSWAAGVPATTEHSTGHHPIGGTQQMSSSTVTVKDGTTIYYKDWGTGEPIVFSHGWPLSADAWEDHMFFLAQHGYRCIAHDRRGHGRSSQPWNGNDVDTFADDLAELLDHLQIKKAIHVGHSAGGGEVARFVGRHGAHRVEKAVLISAVVPLMLKTDANPGGLPMSVFDGLRAGVVKNRAEFWQAVSLPFYGYNRPGAKVSEDIRRSFWLQAMLAGFPGNYFGIKAFSEVDVTEDLKKMTMPSMVIHGDDDQFVPLADTGAIQAKLMKNCTLKVYKGAPHGLPTTEKERVCADLLEFIKAS
jgi:non-heme chloroperoxidase